jgi:hypothetical protein
VQQVTPRFIVPVVMAAALVASGACASPRRATADVTGWYVREDSSGREVIDVRQDSQYVHVVAPRGAAPRADTARWHALGDSAIALDDFRAAPDVATAGAHAARVQGTMHHDAQGELALVTAGDARLYVRRLRYGRQRGR